MVVSCFILIQEVILLPRRKTCLLGLFLSLSLCVSFKNIYFIYLFLGRGSKGEKHRCARETPISCLSHTSNGDLAHNLGMSPDWESNWPPFGSQAGTQPSEPHQPGLILVLLNFGLLRYFLLLIDTTLRPTADLYPYCLILGFGSEEEKKLETSVVLPLLICL